MTDFSDVRIPATRLGSGSSRAMQRMRRHVTKGFYDEAPSGSGGSYGGDVVINEINNWTTKGDYWFNVYKKTLSADNAETLDGPSYVGQWLVLNLEYSNGHTWTCSANVTQGSTDYTSMVLDADGDNITLMGISRSGTLRWYVIAKNGVVLS